MPPDRERDYEVGYGKPPRHTRFTKGQSGNPRGRPPGAKNLKTLLSEALNEWSSSPRMAGVARSPSARRSSPSSSTARPQRDWQAIKILLDMVREIEGQTEPALRDLRLQRG